MPYVHAGNAPGAAGPPGCDTVDCRRRACGHHRQDRLRKVHARPAFQWTSETGFGPRFRGWAGYLAESVALRDVRRKVGLVFQYPEHQLFEESVASDIAFAPRNMGLADNAVDDAVREAMRIVDLNYEEFAERSPFELSGGQKRRVAIAGVIAHEA